jgi:hypothetical protein
LIDKERLCAKTFLEFKARSAGEKITVAEIEAMVKADVDCYKAALNEVEKESEYTKWNEKLMAAKKMCGHEDRVLILSATSRSPINTRHGGRRFLREEIAGANLVAIYRPIRSLACGGFTVRICEPPECIAKRPPVRNGQN